MSIHAAIIIVTYNGMRWVDRCIRSVSGKTGLQVIVVDNVSVDGTPQYIMSHYPDALVIKSSSNIGFGKANNLGISEALKLGASSVFLLNQDAWLADGVLEKLFMVQSQNPGFGILSPVHLNGLGDDLDVRFEGYCKDSGIDRDLLWSPNTDTSLTTTVVKNENSPKSTNPDSNTVTVKPVDFVNAAGWLISGECLRLVGGFHPAFFMYGEDFEYIQRLKEVGLHIGVCPGIYMHHDRADRPKRNKTEEEIYFFGVRSTIALCMVKRAKGDRKVMSETENIVKETNNRTGYINKNTTAMVYTRKGILNELYKPFLLKFLRSPFRSIKIICRKLIILHQVREIVNSIPESKGEYRYLSIPPVLKD